MSDGRIHKRLAVAGFIVVLIPVSLTFYFSGHVDHSLSTVIGGFLAIRITPDRDHKSMTHEKYQDIKHFGFFGMLWIAEWIPYSAMFKHRSRWSHSIVGTVLRALYFLLITVINATVIHTMISLVVTIIPMYDAMTYLWNIIGYDNVVIVVLSWIYIDLYHYYRDGIYKSFIVFILTTPRLLVRNELPKVDNRW